ncbi:hypothetical protein NKR23_g9155 [Pleurostoma richardsiae]|uniref:SnoaL-like domain-containing protein n=1 Tax=Pleurostoma richardsiae TaxID=41990 RepID=A0AA38VCF1_9PEZI|nr:hypothetical protein NKR23_g9155 [Pleurostoma richardsiae]
MASDAGSNRKKLDDFWMTIISMKPDSPDIDYQKLGSFIKPGAKLHLSGMANPLAVGPEGVIAGVKDLSTRWSMVHLRRRSCFQSNDGTTLVTEMDNDITFMGEAVPNFPETEVVEFGEDGLIASYRLYCDGTPLTEILQRKAATK